MQSLVLSRSALSSFQQAGFSVLLFSRRHMSIDRVARELRREDDSRDLVRWNEMPRTNPLELHPYLQVQESSTYYRQGRSSAPNLAAFTVAAAAAGMVTALLFETKEEEQSWLGRGIEGPLSPYPQPTATLSHTPNPLRVRLEFVMAEQQRLGAELEALSQRRWSREAARRRKELAKALKDLESEQGRLVEDAKRQLLRQTQ